MKDIESISEEIPITEENTVVISRGGHDGAEEFITALPIGLLSGGFVFFLGLPLEFIVGAGGLVFLSRSAIGTYFSMQKLAGDYIEMISPRRSLLTRKEQMKAWAFLPGKELNRVLETYYVKDKGNSYAKRLESGLIFGLNRVEKNEATHKVTHEIKSSWRGAKIVQTIEPMENFLWDKAMEDTASLFEVALPEIQHEFKPIEGTTIAERIQAIEAQTSKNLTS